MNVLSLFDGMSCAQIALNRANIKYDKYYASEIKKHAIKLTQYHYPNTIQLGDVRGVRGEDLPKIDILLGGSPCQHFSFLNSYREEGKYGLDGDKSKLFHEFDRLRKECNPKYFLLENVRMRKDNEELLNQYLGVKAIHINSNLVSAQNRHRLYWTNIPNIEAIIDNNINLKDILEANYNNLRDCKVNKTPSRDKMWLDGKCKNITNSLKSSCLTTKMDRWNNAGLIEFEDYCRFLTPIECERLQTVDDNWTSILSKSQRYDVLGDGWTIDVIVHILKHAKFE